MNHAHPMLVEERLRADNAEKKLATAKKGRSKLEALLKISETDVGSEKRIRKKIQDALTKSQDDHRDYVDRHGGYSGAYDSLVRGLGRIDKELPHMAQLAIMSLISTAEIWLKPADEES